MSDLLRMTGMYSGMDTESIIQSLVSTKQQKVTNLKNDQKKLEWKQNVWQDLNKKIYGLYSSTLSNMRLTGSYAKKSTKCSDATKATIVAGDNAVNGSQTLEIKQLAKAGYLTGAALSPKDENGKKSDWTKEDTLAKLDKGLVGSTIKLTVGEGDEAKTTDIEIDATTKISDLVNKMKEAGVNASFDEKNQRFFISSTGTGKAKEFKLESENYDTTAGSQGNALHALGLEYGDTVTYDNGSKATRIEAQDAEIVLNGAAFTSDTNTFNVNGLTITAQAVTDEELSITTDTDYDGIYDMIKDFVSEYNEIINEVNKRYSADSARKYNMLTDEEKEAMTDEEVEKWENTIKDSLLRRDGTLSDLKETLTGAVNKGFEVNGKTMYLFDFGIETLGYFEAEKSERLSLHIAGDPDDDKTSTKTDKLKSAIASDPEGTIQFFSSLCKNMYDNLYEAMKPTDYRSIYKVYEDKRLKTEYDDYTKKISAAEEELNDYEDKWYDKFSAMEVALSKLQSNQNSISSMLGM